MKRLIRVACLALLFAVTLSVGSMAPAMADSTPCNPASNPLACACSTSGGSTSTACATDGTDPISGSNGVLAKASIIIATIAGIAAVIVIIIAGFQYILSNGDSQKTANARSAIIGAAVGLVIIASAEGILLLVVSKL